MMNKKPTRQTSKAFWILLIVLAVVALYICFNVFEEKSETNTVTTAKTKEEVYVEAGKTLVDEAKAMAERKHHKDSISMANKKQIWVYQIGSSMSNENDVFDKYRILRSLGNVYAFKQSRHNYILVIDDGHSEAELRSSLDAMKIKLEGIEARIGVINLTTLCSKKENPVKGDNLTDRKQDIQVPCYICDK